MVGELATELRAASDTAGQTALTADAYGETAQRFVSLMERLTTAGKPTLQAGIEALEAIATDLRDTAVVYEQQEATGRDLFSGIGIGIGEELR